MFKYKNDHHDVYIENESTTSVTYKSVIVDFYEACNKPKFHVLK